MIEISDNMSYIGKAIIVATDPFHNYLVAPGLLSCTWPLCKELGDAEMTNNVFA